MVGKGVGGEKRIESVLISGSSWINIDVISKLPVVAARCKELSSAPLVLRAQLTRGDEMRQRAMSILPER